ncbi:MAG TPA: oligosaccharide flippase family protein [Gammaproteobacteria bacterium]|nr:oligosaccharide flippase family protein [Gammaproteobacteria bacterium]
MTKEPGISVRFSSPVARVAATLLSTQFVGSAVRFAYLVAIARMLPPADVGIYSFGMALYLTMLGAVAFGQNIVLSTYAGRRGEISDRLLHHSLSVTIAAVTVAIAFGVAVVFVSEESPRERVALIFLIAALGARAFVSWVRNFFIANEDVRWIPSYEFSFRLGEAVTGCTLIWSGAGLVAVCGLHFGSWVIEAVAAWRLVYSRAARRLRLGRNWRLLVRLVQVSAVYAVGYWLIQTFPQWGAIALKFVQPDPVLLAQFAIAMQLLIVLAIFPLALGQAMIPGIGRARRLGSSTDLLAVATVMKAAIIMAIAFAICAETVAVAFIPWIFGREYVLAGETLATLSWTLGPYSVALLAVQSLNAFGERASGTLLAALMAVLFFAGVGLFFPLGHLEAVTSALILASALSAIAGAVLLAPRLGLSRLWWVPAAMIAAVCAAIFAFFDVGLLIATPASTGVLVASTWALGVFSREEVAAIAAAFRKRSSTSAQSMAGSQ